MNRIYALQGRGNSGKTTTIQLLSGILVLQGYTAIPGMHQDHGNDFLDIYTNGRLRVGVTSSGDTYDLLFPRLTNLVNAGCNVCICACRTRDNVVPGTNSAVNSFPGYTAQFVPKTYASNLTEEPVVNAADAAALFSLL